MKKTYIITIFLFLICCATNPAQKVNAREESQEADFSAIVAEMALRNIGKLPNKRVVVFDFTDIDGNEMETGKLLAEQVTTRLVSVTGLIVVERQQLNKVLKEQELNASGATENQDEELGKLLNADAIISGTLAQINENEEMNARMIDITTGEIYCAANAKKEMKQREKEFDKLPPDKKEKINKELLIREKLKKENPKLYQLQEEQKKELWLLREKDLKSFQRILKITRFMERLKRQRPKIFLAVTAPEDSRQLEKIKYTKPDEYEKVMRLRKELNFVFEKIPGYKERLKHYRQQIITQVREK
ncbi:MAG: FlgO family outer membrane protein [bacterium]|nr:FlgO family outer membrane protein [bacterium]